MNWPATATPRSSQEEGCEARIDDGEKPNTWVAQDRTNTRDSMQVLTPGIVEDNIHVH